MNTYNVIKSSVERLANSKVPAGYDCQDVHLYTDENGEVLYAKTRYKNPIIGEKWLRSFSQANDGNWQMKEPDFRSVYPQGNGKKPLYRLPNIVANVHDTVYIFEGEQKADLAIKLGLLATTTGGSSTINSHYWQPLIGRNVILWRDNDAAGKKWLSDIILALQAIGGVDATIIDVDILGLPAKGDIVDFANILYADGEDDLSIARKIKDLPILQDSQVIELLPEQSKEIITQPSLLEPPIAYEIGVFEHCIDGVFYVVYDKEGEVKNKTFICSSLTIKARTRDEYSENWGMWCQWRDRDRRLHDLSLPISLLQGDSREYRKIFADGGLIISTNSRARNYLDAYLNLHPVPEMALCTNKTGWHGEQYVLPRHVFGVGQPIVYQNSAPQKTHYAQKGTLADWQHSISQPMANQSKVAFAIASAFAGQLLPLINENGGGFHFVGSSSKGKSLTAKLACSVWGEPKTYIHSWRATSNAQENIAFQHNHGFIALDEINLAKAETIGDVVYMLADGEGKDRMSKTGQNRPTQRWQVMYLSTGEETLETIQNSVNKKTKAGQEVRFISLDAVTDAYLGVFDSLVTHASPSEQANALLQSANDNYGTAGIAWLDYITQDKNRITQQALTMINNFLRPYQTLSSQAQRVGRMFATVASAGELATEAGITGWQVGKATAATQKCFENWLDSYGREGDREERQILKHIRLFIQTHGESRFANWGSEGFIQKVNNRVGFISRDNKGYLFFTDSFEQICHPYLLKTVLALLKKHKLLSTNETNRDTYKVNPSNGLKSGRYYCIKSEVLNYNNHDTGEVNELFNDGMIGNMGSGLMPASVNSHVPANDSMGTLGTQSVTAGNNLDKRTQADIPVIPMAVNGNPFLQSHAMPEGIPISQ